VTQPDCEERPMRRGNLIYPISHSEESSFLPDDVRISSFEEF